MIIGNPNQTYKFRGNWGSTKNSINFQKNLIILREVMEDNGTNEKNATYRIKWVISSYKNRGKYSKIL